MPSRTGVAPKSYLLEGQPRSTSNVNPSRAYVGNCRQCHYGVLSLNLRLKYLGGQTWTYAISFHQRPFKTNVNLDGKITIVDSCNL